jgi:hypothetical protein
MMTPGNAPQVSVQEATEAIVEKQEMRTCRECGHVHKTDFYCLHVIGPGNSCGCVVGVHDRFETLKESVRELLEAVKIVRVVLNENGFPLAAKALDAVISKAEASYVEPD